MRAKTAAWVILLILISSIVYTQTISSPYSPDEGLRRYQEATGRRVYHVGKDNPYEVKGYKGECTWFVYAVREDKLPTPGKGDAWKWYEICKNAGYAVGTEPKVGSIAVWNQNVAQGHGHVAFVTEVNPDGSFEVWDSNWSRDLDHKVRHRRVTSQANLTGFIYWPNGRTEETIALDRILFCMEDEKGQTALWTINPDGSGLKKWMDWNRNWGMPSFSPDGKKMFYDKAINDKEGMTLAYFIYSMDLETGQVKQFFPKREDYTQWASEPRVSPDGSKILFRYNRYKEVKDRESRPGYATSENRIGNPQNWVINIDGSDAHSLGDELDWCDGASWSRDGREVIFADLTSLFAYNLQTRTFRDIVGKRRYDGPNIPMARWSPVSDWIAFTSSEVAEEKGGDPKSGDFWHDLYLIRPNGQEKKLLVGDLKFFSRFDWSTDGKEIVLLAYRVYLGSDKGCKLIVINVKNPFQRRIIFQTEETIYWVMWNSFRANF